MRIGFKIGPFYLSSSTRRRRKSTNGEGLILFLQLVGIIILVPIFLLKLLIIGIIKLIIWLFKGRENKLKKELVSPDLFFLTNIVDDRSKPQVKRKGLSKEEFNEQWVIWRKSQEAMNSISDWNNRETSLKLIKEQQLLDTESIYLKYTEAYIHNFLGRKKETYNLLKQLNKCPNQTFLHMRIDSAIEVHEYEDALIHIGKLSSTNQLETENLFRKAKCLIGLSEWNAAQEALSTYNYRLKANQGVNNSMWHYLKGLSYEGLNKNRKALSEFEKTLVFPLTNINVEEKIFKLRKLIQLKKGVEKVDV